VRERHWGRERETEGDRERETEGDTERETKGGKDWKRREGREREKGEGERDSENIITCTGGIGRAGRAGRGRFCPAIQHACCRYISYIIKCRKSWDIFGF